MRRHCIAVIAASLLFTSGAGAQPLSPGKPAGVHQARNGASTGLLLVGSLMVGALAAMIAFTGDDKNTGVINPPASTGTTS